QGTVDPSSSGRKIFGIHNRTGSGGYDRVNMVSCVSVNTHEKGMGMRDNRHSGRWAFPKRWTWTSGRSMGRYQSGCSITSEQHCDESRRGLRWTIFLSSHPRWAGWYRPRSEEHTSELQSRFDLVCRLLLEKKKTQTSNPPKSHSTPAT